MLLLRAICCYCSCWLLPKLLQFLPCCSCLGFGLGSYHGHNFPQSPSFLPMKALSALHANYVCWQLVPALYSKCTFSPVCTTLPSLALSLRFLILCNIFHFFTFYDLWQFTIFSIQIPTSHRQWKIFQNMWTIYIIRHEVSNINFSTFFFCVFGHIFILAGKKQ